MGCCFSRAAGPNSPYPGGGPSASARAIIIPAAAAAAGSPSLGSAAAASPGHDTLSSAATASSPRTRAPSFLHARPAQPSTAQSPPRPALAQHINKALRRRRWASRNRVWTRRAIDRERTDFFDTRVTGRPEIWQTLHATLEVLWEADLAARASDGVTRNGEAAARAAGRAEAAEALATAQSMLNAADITLPTGDLAQGAYDALGGFYALPAWIVSDPTNVDNDPEHDLDDVKGHLGDDDGDEDADDDLSDGETEDDGGDSDGNADDDGTPSLQQRREEKGKAVAVAADQISVRARLSATSRDVVVHLGREETVRSLIHRISEEEKLPHKPRIRIAYLGKILKEGSSLMAQGWKEGHVVNALVFD